MRKYCWLLTGLFIVASLAPSDAARRTSKAHKAKYSRSWERKAMCGTPREVGLAGRVVLRIRAAANEDDCQARADTINGRLTEMLNGPVRSWDIQVKENRGEWGVYSDKDLVITADSQSASVNGCSSRELAQIWAANLKKVVHQVLPYGYSPQADAYKRKMEREAAKR